jgi:tol-pal system protein YbgF
MNRSASLSLSRPQRTIMSTCLKTVASAATVVAIFAGSATAQQTSQPRSSTAAKTTAPKPANDQAGSATGAASGTESALRQRVEQLEEQLVEMQVTIGTLESLTKGAASSSGVFRGGSTAAAPAAGSGDSVRVDALEQQMRQLSSQMEQLTQQVRQANSRQGAVSPPAASGAFNGAVGGGLAEADPVGRTVRAQSAVAGATPPPAFGSTTVQPDPGNDQIGRVIAGGSASDTSPKQLYETGYGYLLAQDYGAAEVAFDDFLKRFPNDQLAGNAQYWLGETHFVRGQFKAAAGAFLKGYQTYARSSKAPDSLLKLAMSLDRLGQKDAACSSFNELSTKFPNATAPVRNRADAERRRLACA